MGNIYTKYQKRRKDKKRKGLTILSEILYEKIKHNREVIGPLKFVYFSKNVIEEKKEINKTPSDEIISGENIMKSYTIFNNVIVLNPKVLKVEYFLKNFENLTIIVINNKFFVDNADQSVSCLYKIKKNGSLRTP